MLTYLDSDSPLHALTQCTILICCLLLAGAGPLYFMVIGDWLVGSITLVFGILGILASLYEFVINPHLKNKNEVAK